MTKIVEARCCVLIVVVLILLRVQIVPCISANMRLLQVNIQSLNTSLQCLRYAMQSLQIDIAALQEIWHPADESIHIKDYGAPIMKMRTGREGGGVAIYTKNCVKKVHLKHYDVNGLEAVWADVMVDKCRFVVGSVYIVPGDITALNLLDSTIEQILREHSRLIIAMDSNSRHVV